jgi:hypothetical protein
MTSCHTQCVPSILFTLSLQALTTHSYCTDSRRTVWVRRKRQHHWCLMVMLDLTELRCDMLYAWSCIHVIVTPPCFLHAVPPSPWVT